MVIWTKLEYPAIPDLPNSRKFLGQEKESSRFHRLVIWDREKERTKDTIKIELSKLVWSRNVTFSWSTSSKQGLIPQSLNFAVFIFVIFNVRQFGSLCNNMWWTELNLGPLDHKLAVLIIRQGRLHYPSS